MSRLQDALVRHARHYALELQRLHDTFERGERDAPLAEFEQEWEQLATAQARAAELDEELGFLFFAFGRSLLELRRSPEERVRWLQPALRMAEARGDVGVRAELTNDQGNVAYQAGDLDGAARLYEAALDLAAGLRDRTAAVTRAGWTQNLGNVHLQRRDFPAAIARFTEALKASRAIGDARGQAVCLGSLGIAHADGGDHVRAVELYERAIAMLRGLNEPGEMETFTGNLGNSESALGRHAQALEHLLQALSLAEQLRDPRRVAARTGNLASAYQKAGNLDAALEYGRKALELARERALGPETAIAVGRLAGIHVARGDAKAALTLYAQAEARFRTLGMDALANAMHHDAEQVRFGARFVALMEQGMADQEAGRLNEAARAYHQGLLLARKRGSRGRESRALGNLGWLFLQARELDDAEAYFKGAARLSRDEYEAELHARNLSGFATVRLLRGDHAAAEEGFRRALDGFGAAGDALQQGRVGANLGAIAAGQGRHAEARLRWEAAMQCFQQAGDTAAAGEMRSRIHALSGG